MAAVFLITPKIVPFRLLFVATVVSRFVFALFRYAFVVFSFFAAVFLLQLILGFVSYIFPDATCAR